MRTEEQISRLSHSKEFHRLVKRRLRMSCGLSLIMLCVYGLYFYAIAWLPAWMGSVPLTGGSVSVGIWFIIIAVLFSVGISAFYIRWAARHHDSAMNTLLENNRQDAD